MSAIIVIIFLIPAIMLYQVDSFNSFEDAVGDIGGANTSNTEDIAMALMVILVFAMYRYRFAEWSDEGVKPSGYPPRPTRQFTTWVQYQFWAALYAVSGCVVMLFVYKYPAIFQSFDGIPILSGVVDFVRDASTDGQSVLAFSVAISLGFLTLPKLEPRLRGVFQQAALIPSRATHVVDSIVSDFPRFQPSTELSSAFVQLHNQIEKVHLYEQEMQIKVDQGFLEIYPRIEFLFWQIGQMQLKPKIGNEIKRFSKEVGEVSKDLEAIRRDIERLGASISVLIGGAHSDDIIEMHKDIGINWKLGDPIAVTIYDDILKSLEGWGVLDSSLARIAEMHAMAEIKAIRRRCDRVFKKIVLVCVLSVFAVWSVSPENRLRKLGFAFPDSLNIRVTWDKLILITIPIVPACIITLFGLRVFEIVNEVSITITTMVAMNLSGAVGGLLVGVLIINEKLIGDADRTELYFGPSDFLKCGVVGWAFVIFALFLLAMQIGNEKGNQLFTIARYYAHVPSLLGIAIAYSIHQNVCGRPEFSFVNAFYLVLGSAVATVLSVLVHFDDQIFTDLDARRKAIGYIIGSCVAPTILGLFLLRPVRWFHPKGRKGNAAAQSPPNAEPVP